MEIRREISVGGSVAVVGDGFLEVGGDLSGIRVAHTGRLSAWPPVGTLLRAPAAVAPAAIVPAVWSGEGGAEDERGGGDESGE